MKSVFATIFTILFLLWAGVRTVNHIQFDRNIGGYLKRAADANTVELAEKNLSVAVEYLEKNGLTSGYTSILYRTPDEDVGFWFTNLKSSLDELHAVKPEAARNAPGSGQQGVNERYGTDRDECVSEQHRLCTVGAGKFRSCRHLHRRCPRILI